MQQREDAINRNKKEFEYELKATTNNYVSHSILPFIKVYDFRIWLLNSWHWKETD